MKVKGVLNGAWNAPSLSIWCNTNEESVLNNCGWIDQVWHQLGDKIEACQSADGGILFQSNPDQYSIRC